MWSAAMSAAPTARCVLCSATSGDGEPACTPAMRKHVAVTCVPCSDETLIAAPSSATVNHCCPRNTKGALIDTSCTTVCVSST